MNSTLAATFPECRFSCFSSFTYSTSTPSDASDKLVDVTPNPSASASSGDAHAHKDRQRLNADTVNITADV